MSGWAPIATMTMASHWRLIRRLHADGLPPEFSPGSIRMTDGTGEDS